MLYQLSGLQKFKLYTRLTDAEKRNSQVMLKLLRFEKGRNESELSVLIERPFGLYIELQEDTPNPRLEGYDYNTLILSLTEAVLLAEPPHQQSKS